MKKSWIICFLISLLATPATALQFYFKKYQVENGLSHNTVAAQLQDSYGFLWFGTSDGLNRFDGKKFKIYRTNPQEKLSLGTNSVQALFEDDAKNIWVGTSKGLYIYNRQEDNFRFFNEKTQYNVVISSDVKKILKTSKGLIWIATLGQGIFIYNPHTNILTQNSQYTSFVWDICQDQNNRIYASSLQEGLVAFDQNGKYIYSETSFLNKMNIGNTKINCIQSINAYLWFSIGTNNLCKLDSKTKQLNYYTNSNQKMGVIRCIAAYNDKEILIGSDNGLYLFDILAEKFTRVDNPSDPRSLSDQSIYGILKDVEGGLWIATYMGGVNYLAQQTNVFEYYFPAYNSELSSGKVISQFCENKDGNLFIGSQDGLKLLNNKTQRVEPYTIPGNNQKQDIRSLLLDGDNLWIGTFAEGLKIVNLKTNKLTEYTHQRTLANTICSNDVLSLYKDSRGVIYVGTTWGLCQYNSLTNNFTTLNNVGSMVSVFDILEDKHGQIWIATYNSGVYRFNAEKRVWKHFLYGQEKSSTLTSNSIISLFEDAQGTIWLGTNGAGLCSFDFETETFTDFDPSNTILPNKVVYSIEEDNLGNFWIATNGGLLRINPSDKTQFKLFTKGDGLQSNQFNFKSSLKTKTGKLYFGGINGFNAFYPTDFKENSYIPPVYVVNVKLYNTDEATSNELLDLSEPIYLAKEITLPYNKNSLVFEFESLSYGEPSKNKYSYILEGFDKSWINNDNLNVASYTNLPPGEYIFRVKGSNNDGVWNEKGATITIHISPPWWQSTLAYMLYFVLIAALLYVGIRYWVLRTKGKYELQMHDYRLRKRREVYQSKINFFINLVHEIRTPLSLIKLPLEKLLEEEDKNVKTSRYLGIINKNVNYLLSVVNELLDFQKIEGKTPPLHLHPHNINEIVLDIYNQFSTFAELNNKALSISLPEEELMVAIDKEKINKIIVNLLSNAVKYTGSKIELHLHYFTEHFEVHVLDDGAGIPDGEKGKVFEAFYQLKDDASTGTGIGLAYAKLLTESHKGTLTLSDNQWQGSSFVLSIPFYTEIAGLQAPSAIEVVKEIEEIETDSLKKNTDPKIYTALVVEDNIDLQNLIADSLASYFSILKARDGQEALEILATENIDIILSDIMMPGMDGFELCKQVKLNINYSHIPVVLLTARTTLESKIEGLEYGADVYIEKPFSMKYVRMQMINLIKLKLGFQKTLSQVGSPAIADTSLSDKDKDFINKLYIEVEKHLTELDFSIDNVAETMFMSRSNFYRKIKGIIGIAPNEYLKTIRLNKAAELLLEKKHRITDIYEQVGFASSSYFAKCFKIQFGVLPKDYTQEKENKKDK